MSYRRVIMEKQFKQAIFDWSWFCTCKTYSRVLGPPRFSDCSLRVVQRASISWPFSETCRACAWNLQIMAMDASNCVPSISRTTHRFDLLSLTPRFPAECFSSLRFVSLRGVSLRSPPYRWKSHLLACPLQLQLRLLKWDLICQGWEMN